MNGRPCTVAHYRLPLSEGIANRAYAGVALQMLRAALAIEPRLYALGMGGMSNALPRMLAAFGWRLVPVSFYFRVIHPQRFLAELPLLRGLAANVARWTGAGWLGLKLAHWRPGARAARCEPATRFDEVWARCRNRYSFLRDRASVDDDPRFLRLAVPPYGWAVVLDTQMRDHRQFGNLRVGTIADCLAAPEDAAAVVRAATHFLARRGVDLIVSNQSHPAWRAALRRSGFLPGPSNFVFAASKKLAGELDWCGAHINRGDGDGPIHL